MLCETRDPNLVQGFLHLCYAGIQSLEFDEMLEAQAMISAKGERLPFLTPLRTKEAKGCVEKWMMQVRSHVRKVTDGHINECRTQEQWLTTLLIVCSVEVKNRGFI